MKIAIISDIHDHVWNLRAAMQWLVSLSGREAIHELICCGDLCSPFVMGILINYCKDRPIPIHLVFGNNDGDTSRIVAQAKSTSFVVVHNEIAELVIHDNQLVPRAKFEAEQGQDSYFQATHLSDRIAVNHYDNIARQLAQVGAYHLVCFGHNHQYEVVRTPNTLALNPGALMGYNPLKEGVVKDVESTFAVYDTEAAPPREYQFYRVAAAWRSKDQPGEIVPFEVKETGGKP